MKHLGFAGVVWATLYSAIAWGGLGPQIAGHETPAGLCLITLQTVNDMRAEICSGFLLDNQTVVTAGHCTEKMTRQTEIVCDGQQGHVDSFNIPKALDLENIEFDVNLRAQDIAVVQLQTPLNLNLEIRNLATTVVDVRKTLSLSSKCGFFGYSAELGGRVSDADPAVGAISVDSHYLQLHRGYLQLDGARGASALVQPGDSGGAVACKNKGRWVFLGVTSGRDWDYQSFFAPLANHPILNKIPSSVIQDDRLNVAGAWSTDAPNASVGQQYFVRKYAKVTKTQNTELMGFSDSQRLQQWESVHSTLDHPVVRFWPEKRQGLHWLGTIEFAGSTMSYSCIHGFVCSSGKMTQVLVHDQDLQLTPRW